MGDMGVMWTWPGKKPSEPSENNIPKKYEDLIKRKQHFLSKMKSFSANLASPSNYLLVCLMVGKGSYFYDHLRRTEITFAKPVLFYATSAGFQSGKCEQYSAATLLDPEFTTIGWLRATPDKAVVRTESLSGTNRFLYRELSAKEWGIEIADSILKQIPER